jgi:hypothetical protein
LFALLDDVAGIARLAAASLDDVGAAASRAGTKAVGVVVDDAAVTPRYVTGLSPQREWPIIGRIALGSLRNKLLILLPVALLLSQFAPWALTPLLMLGGTFLCFEGAEKVIEAVTGHGHAEDEEITTGDPKALEDSKVKGAVRTDLILSAEIMAIALADVAASPLLIRAVVLALVGTGITVGVYGVVGLIVKLDDVGLYLARRDGAVIRALGRGLVKAMPVVMRVLTVVGTAAMIWVGGGILLHGLDAIGISAPEHVVAHLAGEAARAVPVASGVVHWLIEAGCAGIVGLALGGLVAAVVHVVTRLRGGHASHSPT